MNRPKLEIYQILREVERLLGMQNRNDFIVILGKVWRSLLELTHQKGHLVHKHFLRPCRKQRQINREGRKRKFKEWTMSEDTIRSRQRIALIFFYNQNYTGQKQRKFAGCNV